MAMASMDAMYNMLKAADVCREELHEVRVGVYMSAEQLQERAGYSTATERVTRKTMESIERLGEAMRLLEEFEQMLATDLRNMETYEQED